MRVRAAVGRRGAWGAPSWYQQPPRAQDRLEMSSHGNSKASRRYPLVSAGAGCAPVSVYRVETIPSKEWGADKAVRGQGTTEIKFNTWDVQCVYC